MADSIQYDDSNLQRLFAEMDPKRRAQALKGAFRREANKVRKVAVSNLRGSLNSNKDLEKGIRALVFKRQAGFRVTVGTKAANKKTGKGEAGYHTNRRGLKKPVLIWAEDGTKARYTKSKTKVFKRARKGHSTGRMKKYGFMEMTLSGTRDSVTDELHKEITENVMRVAKRYGCK